MVDPDRVYPKLGSLEEYLRGLREKQDCTRDAYRHDRDLSRFDEFAEAIVRFLDTKE